MTATCGLGPNARALVIYGGATAANTSNPNNGMPWANVGHFGVFLGTYDSGSWVITANHVGANSITFNNIVYSPVAGSGQRIGTTDLYLFRISAAPALSNLTISSSTPNVGQTVYLQADGSGTMTWGTNIVNSYANYNLTQGGPTTLGLITTYDSVAGEAQAQSGDSGGALFYKTATGDWWLSGILSGIGTSDGTQYTASIAVANYYNAIADIVGPPLQAVPEPATLALWFGGLAFLAALFRRRVRR